MLALETTNCFSPPIESLQAGLKIAWETGGGSHHVVITGTEGALPLERSDAQQAQGSNSYPSSIQSRSLPRGQVPEGTGGGTTDDFGQNKKQAVALDMPVYADEIDVGQQVFSPASASADADADAAAVDGVGGGGGNDDDDDDGDYYI